MSLRNYCFTLNNPTDEEIKKLTESKDYVYLIFGFEKGESGTLHLQGYIEMKNKMRFAGVKKSLGSDRYHLEGRMGTQEEAIKYCMKENKYYEFGKKKKMGDRTDLDKARQLAVSEGMRAVTSYCNYQQIKVAEKFLEYNEEQRNFEPEIIWIWGNTGTGKSFLARELLNNSDDIYVKNTNTKWWTGYDAHEFVIIDDFRSDWWAFTYMLGLLDRYPFQLETKGGQRQMLAKKIIVTSICAPDKTYVIKDDPIRQLLRRIDKVYYITKLGDPPIIQKSSKQEEYKSIHNEYDD